MSNRLCGTVSQLTRNRKRSGSRVSLLTGQHQPASASTARILPTPLYFSPHTIALGIKIIPAKLLHVDVPDSTHCLDIVLSCFLSPSGIRTTGCRSSEGPYPPPSSSSFVRLRSE